MATYYIDPVNGNDANDGGGWWKLALASGIGAQPVAGETATGAGGAIGKVIKITGTWATSPTVYLYNRNGTAFANGEAITFSGGGSCVNAQGTPYDAVVASFKTLKKTFAAADIINVAKSPETAAAGTVAAVLGSSTVNSDSASGQKVLKVASTTSFRVGNPVIIGAGTARFEVNQIASIQAGTSLTLLMNLGYTHTAAQGDTVTSPLTVVLDTTNDLTGVIAQYTVIRLDNTLYMVKAISSSAITLYRPYRGAAGSGKSLTYFASLPTSASGDWTPTSFPGTLASPITLQCGINNSTNFQDGFTILYGANNNYVTQGTWNFVNLSRVASLYWNYGWAAPFTGCIITDCYAFRHGFFGYSGGFFGCTVNNLVVEKANWCYSFSLINTTINGLETAEDASNAWRVYYDIMGYIAFRDCVINNWRNAGYNGYNSMYIYYYISNCQFNDAVLDELCSGCTNIQIITTTIIREMHFHNPTLGPGTAFSIYSSYAFTGAIGMSNVNGSSTDYRTYIGQPDNGKYVLLSRDDAVYHTAAPAAKISMFQSAYPTVFRHYIPCDAGVTKTISVYLRKNSSYGSVTLPIMRLRWMTGTAPALVSNVHDVTMVDTNDTFLQYSYAVTPSVQGAIILELIFQSANSGAIAWYDDIGVA